MTAKVNPLQPSVQLLSKLGSIIVHAEELLGLMGHAFDKVALGALFNDPEVRTWIKAMGPFLPVKR